MYCNDECNSNHDVLGRPRPTNYLVA